MKITYENEHNSSRVIWTVANELRSLQSWIDNADFGLTTRGAVQKHYSWKAFEKKTIPKNYLLPVDLQTGRDAL